MNINKGISYADWSKLSNFLVLPISKCKSDNPKNNTLTYQKGKINFYLTGNYLCDTEVIMPDIIDVQIVKKENKPKVIIVSFADGTLEKAVLSNGDTFSLEQGISICVTKKLLSDKTMGNGTSVYNKIIRHAMKVMDKNKKLKEKKLKETEAMEKRMKKLAQKKADRKAKREATVREEKIAIQTEAYLRAMKEFNKSSE